MVPATTHQPQQQPTKQKHKQTTSERHNTKRDENKNEEHKKQLRQHGCASACPGVDGTKGKMVS